MNCRGAIEDRPLASAAMKAECAAAPQLIVANVVLIFGVQASDGTKLAYFRCVLTRLPLLDSRHNRLGRPHAIRRR